MTGMTTFQTMSNSVEWVTAKLVSPIDARRYVNRLDSLGYDYIVHQDNRDLRILVRPHVLHEVLEWIADIGNGDANLKRGTRPQSNRKLLVAIPIGLFVGSVFSNLLSFESSISIAVSGLFGILAAIVASLVFE